MLLVILGFFLAGLSVNSFLVEPAIIKQDSIEISDTGVNMTIAFLSDFQRNDANPTFIQNVVDIVNSKNPDLILLGGDYIEDSVEELPSIQPLKQLKSKFGVYGVMGNHDYSLFDQTRDVEGEILSQQIIKFLETSDFDNNPDILTPIKILQNEKVIIDDKVTVIGLDDWLTQNRDESKAHFDKQSVGYRILLSHNQSELDITKDMADLYLFGHTHCGQIRLPGFGSISNELLYSGEYDKGHYILEDGTHVYITCGLAPGPRLLNPPEISIIKLSP